MRSSYLSKAFAELVRSFPLPLVATFTASTTLYEFLMRSILQTAAIAGILACVAGNGISAFGQEPVRSGAYSETPFPVGAPIYLASNETVPTTEAVRTSPPRAQEEWPEAEWDEPRSEPEKTQSSSKSAWSWLPSFSKSSKKKDEVGPDDGLEVVEWMHTERNYSGKDYVESATRDKNATNRDFYTRGLQAENAGDLDHAMQLYNAFIKANGRLTESGSLAAPYHRLALITWKRQQTKESDIYFRYAMRYARGGNISIVAGDYSLFLMERGETARAEVILRNALVHSPENPRLLVYLGRCSTRQHKPVEAMRHFTAALGEEQGYVEMAHVYRQMGEWETALAVDYKRNEYIAEKQKRSIPMQSYAYHPSMPYPAVQVVAPQTVHPPRPGFQAATLPAAPSATATPVSVMMPSVSSHQVVQHPLPAAPPQVAAPAETFQVRPFFHVPEENKPENHWNARPLPPSFAPAPAVEEHAPMNHGWQPHRPADEGIPLSGGYRYPAGARTAVYHAPFRTLDSTYVASPAVPLEARYPGEDELR